MEDQLRQALPGFAAKRRRRIEAAPNFRRIDAEQTHAADSCDVDGVAVNHRPNQHRRRACDTRG